MRRLKLKSKTDVPEFTVVHRPRVQKRLHLELDEKGGLLVVAPSHWSMRHISTTLARNTSRVEQFLTLARERQTNPLRFTQGEQHFYLGERYPLRVHPITGRAAHGLLMDGEIHINASSPAAEKIRAILEKWYKRQAMTVFSERLKVIACRAPWAKDRHVPLKLRRMKRTWGNCSSKGVIKLNTHLVKAPMCLIDSVIAHELCHLEEMNHGSEFYRLLERLNPDWRKHRARLRKEGNIYLL